MPKPEQAAVLALLVSLAQHPSGSHTGGQPLSPAASHTPDAPAASGGGAAEQQAEAQQLALAALLQCFPRGQAPLVPADACGQVLAAAVAALTQRTKGAALSTLCQAVGLFG